MGKLNDITVLVTACGAQFMPGLTHCLKDNGEREIRLIGTDMSDAPKIENSTIEERRAYIKDRFPCIADCDMCGLCTAFHGNDAEQAYDDYIAGKRSFMEVSEDFK